jgi:sulfite exporter TauE/SafE
MTFLAAGFVLGLAASVHCVVMCGPLMMAMVPRRNWRAAVLYHSSRVSTYAVLGAATGAIGHLAMLAGAGRLLSIVAGLALIWTAARRAGWVQTVWGPGLSQGLSPHMTAIVVRATEAARARFRQSSPLRIVSAGALNGLLPCGPAYAALTAAAALGDSPDAAGFMLAFGAGTLPLLTAVGTIAAWTSRVRAGASRWRLVTPVALAVLGVMLTARGVIGAHQHQHAEPRPQHDHAL